jgi:hypothetical protein
MEHLRKTAPCGLIVILIGVCALLGAATLNNGHGWGDDFASYIMQAQSVIARDPGAFIRANSFTILQSTHTPGPIAYPWGVPVLLAPLYRFFGFNLVALKGLNLACLVMLVGAMALFFRRRHTSLGLVGLIALFALNPTLLFLLNDIGSDTPFLFFSTVCIFVIQMVIVEERRIISDVVDYVLLGALLAAGLFIRTTGMVLIVVAAATQLIKWYSAIRPQRAGRWQWREHRRALLVACLPYITLALLSLVWPKFFPQGGGTYTLPAQLSSILITGQRNVSYYAQLLTEFMSGVPQGGVLFAATAPFFLWGVWRRARREYPLWLWPLGVILLYLMWPSHQGIRFILPVFPFYFHFVVAGLESATMALAGWRARTVQVGLVAVLILVGVCFGQASIKQAWANVSAQRAVTEGPFAPKAQEMLNFVRQNIPQEAVVAFFKPRLVRMVTNHRSYQIDRIPALAGADYLCMFIYGYDQLPPAAISDLEKQGVLTLIFTNNDFQIYRIAHTPTAG